MKNFIVFLLSLTFFTKILSVSMPKNASEFNAFHKKIISWSDKPMPRYVHTRIDSMIPKLKAWVAAGAEEDFTISALLSVGEDAIQKALSDTQLSKEEIRSISVCFIRDILVPAVRHNEWNEKKECLTTKGKFIATVSERLSFSVAFGVAFKEVGELFTGIINAFRDDFVPEENKKINYTVPNVTLEVAKRRTLFGFENRIEYFFTNSSGHKGKKIDNEQNDGQRYWFYAKKYIQEENDKNNWEKVNASIVDKTNYPRAWLRYGYNTLKYPALAAVTGYGLYKGAQSEQGKKLLSEYSPKIFDSIKAGASNVLSNLGQYFNSFANSASSYLKNYYNARSVLKHLQ